MNKIVHVKKNKLIFFNILIKYIYIAGTPTCQTNQFQCRSTGICINKQLVCDGYPHCQDRSDESNCSKMKNKIFYLIEKTFDFRSNLFAKSIPLCNRKMYFKIMDM